MDIVKTHKPFSWLIKKTANLAKPRKGHGTSSQTAARSLSIERRLARCIGTMAEAEEDFSSLPLPDRFAHKVCVILVAPCLTRAYSP